MMDASSPVSSAELAQRYKSSYEALKKNFEDHHAQIVAVQEELISSQSQQIFSYEKQLQAQREKLVDGEARILVLQDEVAELKGRLARVAESVSGVVRNNATQRMSNYSTQHDRESGGKLETVSEHAVVMKKDLLLRQDKELPPRPESTVSSILNDIDDMIIEIEAQPDMNISSVPSATDFRKSSSSQGTLVLQQAMEPQPLSPGFYHMSSPIYAFTQQPRCSTASPRLQSIGEDAATTSTSNLNTLPFNEFQPTITERIQTNSPVPRPRSSSQPQPSTPRVLAETHPLLRQLSPLSQTTSSSGYSQRADSPSPGSKYPIIQRKETFIEKLKRTSKIPEPHKNRKSTNPNPDPGETDSIIRAKIRTEAERRKAANFGPGDKVERSGVIHSMTLSSAEPSEIRPTSLGTRSKTTGFENPQLDAVKRVTSAGSKGTGGSRSRMGNVVRRWKSDLWKMGSGSKRVEE